jgi:hybrid cluster-associated redox disulfide protein
MNAQLRYSATRLSPVNEPITKDMVIREVRDKYPGITAVFQAHGLPCAGCHVGSYETIAGGARTHNLDVEAILADLNKFVRDGTVPPARGRPTGLMAQAPKRGDVTIEGIKHIIAVASGKGGVGKSLVTALLAVTLKRKGYKVGILDGDITGPSIPRMFGVPVRSLRQVAGQHKPNPPLSRGGMPVMSMNVLLDDPEAAVVWRGPMVSGAIRQFYTDMNWGDLDYLLVDLPPGTSDAPMTVMQQLPTDGAVLVSTPQGLATMVVSKAIQMVKKFEVPIVGVVENMSYVELPDGTSYELFGPSKGQRLVALSGAPLLGRLPIDPQIALLSDEGRIEEYDSEPYRTLAENFLTRLEQRAEARPALPVISSRSLAGVARNVHGPPPSDVVAAGRDPHEGGERPPTASPQAAPAHPVAQPSVEPAQNGGGERGAKLLRLSRFLKHGN